MTLNHKRIVVSYCCIAMWCHSYLVWLFFFEISSCFVFTFLLMVFFQYIYILLRIRARQRAISHATRIATESSVRYSVVTLLGLPPETSHGWGFDPTTTQSADYPCGIGSIAQRRYTYGTAQVLCRGEAPRPGRLRTRTA